MTASPDTAAPAPEKASLIEDFIDIFTSPSKVFARRANSGFFLVLLIVTVLIGAIFLANRGAMQGIMDAEYNRQMQQVMEQRPGLTQEQLDAGKGMASLFATVGIFIMMPIIMLCLALVTWLVSKMFGASFGFGAAGVIASYAYIPRVVEALLGVVQGLVLDTSVLTGRYQLSLGVGRFLDPGMNAGVLGILGRVDVFTIWVTILIGIGISVIGKIPRTQAFMAAGVIYVVGALPALLALARG